MSRRPNHGHEFGLPGHSPLSPYFAYFAVKNSGLRFVPVSPIVNFAPFRGKESRLRSLRGLRLKGCSLRSLRQKLLFGVDERGLASISG